MKIAPCKDCKDRAIGCHGTCEKYSEYRKQREKERELRYKKQQTYYVHGAKSKDKHHKEGSPLKCHMK